jgi:hypothetical protein
MLRKQKPHKMSDEKVAAAKAEVQRLLDIGFICKVQYPSWLTNVVMVKKKNGKMENVHRFYQPKQVLSEG